MDLSIVVPLYNEQDNVVPLHEALAGVLDGLGLRSEMIFVDDGSTDATFAEAERLAGRDSRLRVVKFRRNYGQTPAMAAGIDLAAGRQIVTLDGDLQNDPADIPALLAKLDEGYDMVVGWRHTRKDRLLTRRVPSQVANWLIGKVTSVRTHDIGCTLKAFRADFIKHLPLYSDMHRFIPALAAIAGPKIAEIKVQHHARRSGKSKYGLSRAFQVLLQLLTIKTLVGFASRPLQWFAVMAAPALLLGFALVTGSIFVGFFGEGPAMPMAGAGLFFGSLGVYLIFNGVLAELISKTCHTHADKFPLLTAREIAEPLWATSRFVRVRNAGG